MWRLRCRKSLIFNKIKVLMTLISTIFCNKLIINILFNVNYLNLYKIIYVTS